METKEQSMRDIKQEKKEKQLQREGESHYPKNRNANNKEEEERNQNDPKIPAKKNMNQNTSGPQANIWLEPVQSIEYKVLGYLSSVFKEKNGTPRQGILCKHTKASLKLTSIINAHHCLEGLQEFSHVLLIFHFHENGNADKPIKLKVTPPRTDDKKKRIGVMATRSPHRPNAIGLSVARLEGIKGDTLFFSGIDLIDKTPILDIKPYIPQYDSLSEPVRFGWVENAPRKPLSNIFWEPKALQDIQALMSSLEFYIEASEVKEAIEEVLQLDPRSIYRKTKQICDFGFCLDNLNVVCKFDVQAASVTVIELQDWSDLWGASARIKKNQKKLKKQQEKKEKKEKKQRQQNLVTNLNITSETGKSDEPTNPILEEQFKKLKEEKE